MDVLLPAFTFRSQAQLPTPDYSVESKSEHGNTEIGTEDLCLMWGWSTRQYIN